MGQGPSSKNLATMSDTERETISPVPVSPRKLKGDVDSSDDESSEIVNNGGTDSSSTDNGEHLGTNGVTDRVNGSATDSEEDMEENEPRQHEPVSNGNGFTEDGEPEFKPKKAADSDSSDTEDEPESDGDSEGEIVDKMDNIDVNDGCMASKVEEKGNDYEKESVVKITETAPSPEPIESLSPEPLDTHTPERSPSPEEPSHKSPSPDRSRSPTPERKDSRGSHGSSSYDEERASSLSPEPPKVIAAPTSKLTSPVSPPSSQNKGAITKIYTESLGDSDSEERREKVVRNKPAGNITPMYTQKLVEKEELASSPKTERKEMMFQRPEGMTNITQLYTAAFKEDSRESGGKVKPMRNGNITKLYTEGFNKEPERAFKGKPKDEKTNPIKHNLATS